MEMVSTYGLNSYDESDQKSRVRKNVKTSFAISPASVQPEC